MTTQEAFVDSVDQDQTAQNMLVTSIFSFFQQWFQKASFLGSFLKPFENIIGKIENAAYQHFLLFFQQCFQKASFLGSLKVGIVC